MIDEALKEIDELGAFEAKKKQHDSSARSRSNSETDSEEHLAEGRARRRNILRLMRRLGMTDDT